VLCAVVDAVVVVGDAVDGVVDEMVEISGHKNQVTYLLHENQSRLYDDAVVLLVLLFVQYHQMLIFD
jgi:hypothetical protein